MAIAQPTYAQSWLDSVKGFLGLGEEQTETSNDVLSSAGLVKQLTDSLGVTESQAQGGLGSIFNYAKNNLSGTEFNQIANALPGVEGLLSSMPDISKLSSGEGIGGLLDKAANYSETAKAINDLNKQFEALGLTPEQIAGFVSSINQYLDTPQGQQAKQMLMNGLGQLLSS
jgi:hypothetical protein